MSISTKFGFIWLSGYRAEDRNATVVQIMTTDEGHKVMSISHMTLWARWAGLKKKDDKYSTHYPRYMYR